MFQDYDVERDKYGRIVTGGQGRRDEGRVGRERSRERDRGDRGDWDRVNAGTIQAGGTGWKYGNTYGLSSQFLESLGIDGPLISRVFVSNVRNSL